MSLTRAARIGFQRLALLAVLFSLLPLSAFARQPAARRFQARLHLSQAGPPVPDPRCTPPTELVTLTGAGNATGMARVAAEGSHCIVDDPAEEDFTDGLLVLSGARGDLFLEYSGTDVAGVLDGTFVITGGTGAFAGATGEGTLKGMGSAADERGTIRLRGRIAVP